MPASCTPSNQTQNWDPGRENRVLGDILWQKNSKYLRICLILVTTWMQVSLSMAYSPPPFLSQEDWQQHPQSARLRRDRPGEEVGLARTGAELTPDWKHGGGGTAWSRRQKEVTKRVSKQMGQWPCLPAYWCQAGRLWRPAGWLLHCGQIVILRL